MATVVAMRFSVLDRAAAVAGESSEETLQAVRAHAQHAESLGFVRFLVAEHHGVPGLVGSQPALLSAHLAGATSRIRIGTAGIMVPNHPPLLIAEQIGMLEALFPGRIDIGLGSSVGFTAPVRAALRQDVDAKSLYDVDLAHILSYLTETAAVTAQPAADGRTPIYLLAGFRSALTAAKLGLGIITGGPVETQAKAVQSYRENFHPSDFCPTPRVISSLNIAAATTQRAAADLLLPEAYAKVMAQTTGRFEPLRPARELDLAALTKQQRRRLKQEQAQTITGVPRDLKAHLAEIARRLGVDEFLVTGDMPDRAGRARSEELLAAL